jgi:DNA-binding cell septation regulator SpoVG
VEISEIEARLAPDRHRPELLAEVSCVIANLCIRGIRVVDTGRGTVRVSFPDHPVRAHCASCRYRVPITHKYCHNCGEAQPNRKPAFNRWGVPHLYQSIVFPVTSEARAEYEKVILEAYEAAKAQARMKAG